MNSFLHIHNGDSSAETLRQSGQAGDYLPFREALIEGPTPSGLSEDDWLSTRARFLADEDHEDFEKVRKGLSEQEETLKQAGSYEEVVLWFGHDLFCQITLIYIL